jgi:catechol 2,3-dioxygenase-like lactoylglutathione lyase family enzyme
MEEEHMTHSPISKSTFHHFCLRVEDAGAVKMWLTTVLGFHVQGEFQVAGNDVVFLSTGSEKAPVVELIGGPMGKQRQLPKGMPDIVKLPGWHHIALQVPNIEECMKNLRHSEAAGLQVVRILLDVTEGPPGSGIENLFHRRPLGKHLRIASGRR